MTQPFPNISAEPQPLDQQAIPADAGQRIDALNQNGHSWMPADMQSTLATSDTSHTDMLTIADSIKSTLSQAWNGFNEAFSDPILQKQPSATLALSRYLTAAIGPIPVAEPDLTKIQANLQKQGVGKNLPTNGVWGSDWNAAYNDWISTLKTSQLAGNRPGSISTAKAAGHWYDVLNPGHALNAIVGYVEGIPGDLRDLVAGVVGSVANVFTDPQSFGFHESKAHQEASAGASAARWVESALGNSQAAQRVQEMIAHPHAAEAQDVGTILTVAPLIRTGSAAALAAHGEWSSGVDIAAAQRGPGVIAQTLFGGLPRRQIGLDAGADVSLGQGERGILSQGQRDALRRGPLNTRMFRNIPLLQQAGPVIGKLADADGGYYKLRTLLATPYQYGQVRAAAGAGQTGWLTGAALRGGAQLEQAAGLSNPQNRAITQTNALNTVDLNIQRIAHTPFAHPFTDAIDSLGYIMHGPLGSTAASTRVGDAVQAATDAYSNVLGVIGKQAIWERAVEKASGVNTKIGEIEKAFGSPEELDRFMQTKTADIAAGHYAQHEAQKEGLQFGTDTYRTRVGQLADEVWKNPDLHVTAMKELLAAPDEMANRVAADMIHNNLDPKNYHPDLLDHEVRPELPGYVANAKAWMQGGGHLSDVIRSGDARYLYGADGRTLIANAQDHFDSGLGQDSPVRLLSTTRRDYVNQVTTLQSRVARQVNVARAKAGQDVAQAEQAVAAAPGDKSLLGILTQARKRQTDLEKHLTNSDPAKFAAVAKKIGGPVKSNYEWATFPKNTARLRALVDQATETSGGRLSLQHLVDNGVNPDELYTNINGEPRLPTENIGSGDWMREHLQTPNGSLGLGRLDTKSAQQAAADVARFRQKLTDAQTEQATGTVLTAMKDYAFHEFGIDARTLGVFDNNPEKLADILDERAHDLASEVFLTHDAPQTLKDKIQQIRDLGYRPMVGSHIGHLWDSSLPAMPDVQGALTRRRKIVSALGLAPEQISPRAAGQDARIRVLREIHTVQDDQRAHFPAYTTAETVMHVMTDRNLFTPDMRAPERMVVAGMEKLTHRKAIEQLATERGLDYQAAKTEYISEMTRGLQLRDIPRKQFIDTLTTPGTFTQGGHWAGLDPTTANLVYRAVLRGYSDRPGYIMGLSHLEDWFRNGFSFGDKAAVRYANSEFMQRAVNLPNQLVNARNRARFTLSPFFDWRRISKQNYKMGLDKVVPVGNPLAHMVDNGTFKSAHDYLTRLVGEPQYAGFDDADRYLHQQSVWGMYNSRHFEAYYAWEKKAQGLSDDEIRAGIHRVFDYGTSRGSGGRSALERTVNTVFFPFSFEKTLLRNTGAYMLNHPQQSLLLTGAMTAYNEANQNATINKWVQDHLPILHDLQKLNAFAHGISPGELGGINAPLLNLFMPQDWGKNLTTANLKRNLPIFNDFGRLFHDVREQAIIGKNALLNTADYAIGLGAPRGTLDPYRPTTTPEAQRRDAERMRNQFITQLQPILDYNGHTSNEADKAVFPDDPRLPPQVRGKVVNRTSIGYLVQRWYPAYNPASAAQYAQAQAAKAQAYVDGITDPARRTEYQTFVKLAAALQGHLQRNDYDTPQAAGIMQNFRDAAIAASEQDPTFLKFYDSHYKWLLGPIEEIRG